MAVVALNLTTSGLHATQASYPTASISPSYNGLVLVAVGADWGAGTTVAPTISGFTEITNKTDAGNNRRITIFRAIHVASGALSIAFASNPQDCNWSIAQMTFVTLGNNGADAIVQTANATNGANNSLAVTLGAFSNTNNATYGACYSNNSMTVTAGGSFTEIGKAAIGGGTTIQSEFAATNQTNVNWSYSASQVNVGIAIELKYAVANASFLPFL